MSISENPEPDKPPRNGACADAALLYARLGWRVLPVRRRQKKPPLIAGWQHKATCDATTLAGWWKRWPDANVAVATGRDSGIVVIDVDGEPAELALEELQVRLGRLPGTCEQTTGRGRQLYFEYPKDGAIRNTTSFSGCTGIDVRGEGGYAIVSPSVHPNGKSYTWESSSDPLNGGVLALLPETWAVALQHLNGQLRVGEESHDLHEGGRNAGLFQLACSMRARGCDAATIVAALLAENLKRCRPPLDEHEVRNIAGSAAKYEPGGHLGQSASIITEPWEPPVPLGRFDLPEFPIEAFPHELCALCEFCASVATSFQVPLDLPSLLSLAVAGFALSKRIEVEVQPDWREPVNLFVAPAMESGERKSATFREVVEPLALAERENAERLAPTIEKNRVERDLLAKSIEHAKSQAAKKTDPGERDAAKAQVLELVEQLRTTPEIYYPKFIADDATPEAVGTLLYQNGGRIALLSPEGDTFDLMGGRYSGDRKPNLGVYLKGHAGDDLRVDRKGRPPEFVHRPALTVGLAVQPDVLRGLCDQPGFRGRGLLARFIYSLSQSLVGFRELHPEPIHPDVKRAYADLIWRALALAPIGGRFGPEPQIVTVGPDALVALDRFRAEVEAALRPDGELATLRDWGSKLPGAVCRIAGIFHGLMHSAAGDLSRIPIDDETMLGAIAVGEYAIPHARAAFFEMGADTGIALARRLISWIKERRLPKFSRRDAFNALRGSIDRVEQVDRPLNLLEDHGYVRGMGPPAENRGRGRKPSPTYEVNPHVYAHNEQNAQNPGRDDNSANNAQSAQGDAA